MSGRREQQIKGLLAEFGQEVQEFHDELMRWRNHHVAHRVDDAREQTEARAIIDTAGEQIKAIRVTVSPTLGPEDEGEEVASRFMGHVKVLRDLVWTQRLASTEAKAIAVISGRVQELSRVTVHSRSIEDRKFSIDLDPRGGNS